MNLSLIPDHTILQEFVGVSEAFSLPQLVPHINRVTRKHIIPNLTQSYWDAFVSKLNGTGLDSPVEEELLYYLRTIQANAGLLAALPSLNVRISDAGVMKIETDRESPAYKYQLAQLMQQLEAAAEEGISDMFTVLENNTDVFTEWAGSAAATVYLSSFIQGVPQVQRYTDIGFNRLVFRSLRPHLDAAEQNMAGILGNSLYNQIKQDLPEGLAGHFAQVHLRAIPCLVHSAMAAWVPHASASISESGISFRYLHEENATHNSEKPDPAVLDAIVASHKRSAVAYQQRLQNYLEENASALGYTIPQTEPLNNTKGKSFML